MKISIKFLCGLVCAVFSAPAIAAVATTAGHNLTAYNGTGATNNNQWNSMMNGRAGMGTSAPKADFGNCNAVILRCAQPKCANGGCANMDIAWPIVSGCVNSNESCKQYGNELVEYIAAQMVAQSNAKLAEQQNAVAIAQAQAEAQANAATAAQNNAQMEQMQRQMEQMQAQMAESMAGIQEQMAAQNESQSAQIQEAMRARSAEPTPTTSNSGYTDNSVPEIPGLSTATAAALARNNNIDVDILVREQIGGEIQTQIENAMLEMDKLKKQLDEIIEYAGCDPSASNCTGPKRIKKFKDMANQFFTPYENVVDNMYEALITAVTLGIDVNDVIMLLSDACNLWGKYNCESCDPEANNEYYTGGKNTNGEPIKRNDCSCRDATNKKGCYHRVRTDDNGKVLANQPYCRTVGMLSDKSTVYREWIDSNSGSTGATQVACASDVIANYGIFKNRKKKATMDIETLRRLVNQDSRACTGKMSADGKTFELQNGDLDKDCWMNRCAVGRDSEYYNVLADAVASGKLQTKLSNNNSANVLCYTNANNLPQSIPTEVQKTLENLSNLKNMNTSQTWTGTNISKTVGSNFGEQAKQNLKQTIQDTTIKCSDIKIDSICYNTFGCKWLGSGCIQNIDANNLKLNFKM